MPTFWSQSSCLFAYLNKGCGHLNLFSAWIRHLATRTPDKIRKQKRTATLERIPEFQPYSGNFDVYLETFELFASANDIAVDKELRVFLTAIGEKVCVTLRSLLLPKMATQVHEAVTGMKKHYAPKRSLVHPTVTLQSTETRAVRDRDGLRGRAQETGNSLETF